MRLREYKCTRGNVCSSGEVAAFTRAVINSQEGVQSRGSQHPEEGVQSRGSQHPEEGFRVGAPNILRRGSE